MVAELTTHRGTLRECASVDGVAITLEYDPEQHIGTASLKAAENNLYRWWTMDGSAGLLLITDDPVWQTRPKDVPADFNAAVLKSALLALAHIAERRPLRPQIALYIAQLTDTLNNTLSSQRWTIGSWGEPDRRDDMSLVSALIEHGCIYDLLREANPATTILSILETGSYAILDEYLDLESAQTISRELVES